jgi:hypothetical protein
MPLPPATLPISHCLRAAPAGEAAPHARVAGSAAQHQRIAVRLYWMWREKRDYEQLKKFGSHVGQPGTGVGAQQNIA